VQPDLSNPTQQYAAFVSYASTDRRHARRVQRFLESWVDRRDRRRLKVFLDETDIRGGGLDAELRRAAHASRSLIVCYSPAAAESRWVDSEIEAFSERTGPERIAAAIVGGTMTAVAVGREVVPGAEVRVHDLRRGRWLGLIGLGNKLELLRLLAFIADVDLRTLRNWYLRRTLASITLFVVVALVPLWALLTLPLDDWQPVSVKRGREAVQAIAAEADGDKLLVASRYRGVGPQGFRNYIEFTSDTLAAQPKSTFDPTPLKRRLLPPNRLGWSQRGRVPPVDIAAYTQRKAAGLPFVGEVAPDRFVYVIPLAPTQDEIDEATDNSRDFDTPIPVVRGAIVASSDAGHVVASEVPDLSPVWEEIEQKVGPSSPARGLAVAWSPEGDLWIGMLGRDAREVGGLWVRRAGTTDFEHLQGFASVQSIELEVTGGRTRSVLVTERHLDLWRGIRLVPWPTRVVQRPVGAAEWSPAPAPPFGTRSEVEFVGTLDGAQVVRVDEHLFRKRTIPVWRFLLSR
jgi:hypothetical protein